MKIADMVILTSVTIILILTPYLDWQQVVWLMGCVGFGVFLTQTAKTIVGMSLLIVIGACFIGIYLGSWILPLAGLSFACGSWVAVRIIRNRRVVNFRKEVLRLDKM
jgi:hypothetical protein